MININVMRTYIAQCRTPFRLPICRKCVYVLTIRLSYEVEGDLTHGGHVMPYWLIAWRHQAKTWTNVDWLPVRSCDIRLRVVWQDIPQSQISKFTLAITYMKFNWHLPVTNEFNPRRHVNKSVELKWLVVQIHAQIARELLWWNS